MISDRKKEKIKIFTEFVSKIADLSVSQTLKVGAIAIKIDFSKIGSFGYNGSYAGAPLNDITGGEEESLSPGESGFIHAEMNLIAKFRENDPENYIILLTHSPCEICSKLLINSGFRYIYWREDYRKTDHLSILDDLNILHGNFKDLTNNYKTISEAYFGKKN